MDISLARLDLTPLFCDIDDFCQNADAFCGRYIPRLPYDGEAKHYQSRLSISEVMTIVVAFHGSGYRTFKDFYTQQVLLHWRSAFPNLVSYNRFVELIPWSCMGLMAFRTGCCFGDLSGISFIDSTALAVCLPAVRQMSKGLFCKLFGDRGYISQALFTDLCEQGLKLSTRVRKNLKNELMPLVDKLLLRKRFLIETVKPAQEHLPD
jgi:hypothetical protein